MADAGKDITRLLRDLCDGKSQALDQVFPLVYEELRAIAHRQLRGAWREQTLNTTALVSEAYLKLVRSQALQPQNRVHFFAIAATAMRQILINYAEQQQAQKRGGDWARVTLSDQVGMGCSFDRLLALDRALQQLHDIDEALVQLVELRFFAGLSEVEIAGVLAVSDRTVRRNWIKARTLLASLLEDGDG